MSNLLSPGHAQIKQEATRYAGELCLEGFTASWAEDIISNEHILTIDAGSGTTEIRFSKQEIEEYIQGIDTDEIKRKIHKAVHAISN